MSKRMLTIWTRRASEDRSSVIASPKGVAISLIKVFLRDCFVALLLAMTVKAQDSPVIKHENGEAKILRILKSHQKIFSKNLHLFSLTSHGHNIAFLLRQLICQRLLRYASVETLDVLFKYACGFLPSMPCIRRHLSSLATKSHVISVLVPVLFASLILFSIAPRGLAGTLEDEYQDIVISNYSGSYSYIYWGAGSDSYSTKTDLATYGTQGNALADLNNDGYLDVVFSNYTNGPSLNINSYIYWGAASNPFSTKTELATHGARGVSCADLDDDGYLDVVFSNQNNGTSVNINSYIYWGAASDPYATKTELLTHRALGNAVSDINSDGYLDVVFSNNSNGSTSHINSYIYWGAQTDPYSTKTELPTIGASGSSAADLNSDGYLDIIFTNSWDASTYYHNSYIYWGAESNPYSSKTDLPTIGGQGNSVADLNNDGYLDIVFSNDWNGSHRQLNSYIYWGAQTDPYSSKTEVYTPGGSGNAIGDLDSDGYLDIAFADYGVINSYIYWGAQTNPYATKTELSASGPNGVAISGSNIWGGNSSYGNVIPLWATQVDYSTEVLNSWEYGFIATQNEQLNEGALDFSDEEIAQLAKLYFDQTGSVEIDGTTWRYYSDEIGGHGIPEAWYDGDYYFQMGSGVTTAEGEVPEPSTVVMMVVLLVGMWVVSMRKRTKPVILNVVKNLSIIKTDPSVTTLPQDDKTRSLKGCGYRIMLCLLAASLLLCLFVPIAQAATMDILRNFAGGEGDGDRPRFTKFIRSANTLYGMTAYGGGGTYDDGVIFGIDIDGSNFTILRAFDGGQSDGSNPDGSLTLIGSTLYGMTKNQGYYDAGTIFSIETDGSNFTIMHDFRADRADNGYSPKGTLTLVGDKFYGLTQAGGTAYKGNMFSIGTDGSGFTIMQTFDGTNGSNPKGSVIHEGGYMYGMTYNGGVSNDGVIFSIDTAGGNFTLLHEFVGPTDDGANPQQDLILVNGELYGMTFDGGASSWCGTIFNIGTDGSDFTLLHSFSGASSNGENTYSNLTLSNDDLYGMTVFGGEDGVGTIFRMGTDGTEFTLIYSFTTGTSDGQFPYGSLYIDRGTIFGMTQNGGDGGSNAGTIFKIGTPEFEYIETGSTNLGFGFTDEEMNQLSQLYYDGKAGGSPDPISIGGLQWSYFDQEIGGRNPGDSWEADGTYYLYLGSGLEGEEVPEPSTIIVFLSLLILLITWQIRKPRRAAVKIDKNKPLIKRGES
ncbi:choice-of-anchor tandem repeat GloVer-containing protein [Candidatus Auribacterota bacterium]